jgi:flagellar basal-body rod protein FlgC
MGLFDALTTSASGLSAQRLRMNLISANLANINTTRTASGGPYQRKEPVFAAQQESMTFHGVLDSEMSTGLTAVTVVDVVSDNRPPILKYDPDHPDANDKGFVAMPNIRVVEEMVNMMSASRSYEANVTAMKTIKNMVLKAMEIGR